MGPRGVTVLSIAGIAGLFFGVHGWTQRDTGQFSPPATAPSATSSPSATASPSGTAPASAAAGPQLSSMPYASYAYQVWPGALSSAAKLALSGWTLTVTRQPGGITVKALLGGQPTSYSHFYAGGAKVYALDSNLGDDANGDTDHDDTDDGLAVTNAQGQVLG